MDSNDLHTDQAAKLVQHVRPMLSYLGRVRRRMELLGFPPSDPLYIATTKAFNAMQAVHVQAHYASCAHGVGKPARLTSAQPKSRGAPGASDCGFST